MPKIARLSTGLLLQSPDGYTCAFDWPAECFVQAGERGIVYSSDGKYETAFFEAFPRNPNTFVRGEGETVADAERSAWDRYQRHIACPGHEFERCGYTNGGGFCKHCNMWSSTAFEPLTHCCVCDKPTDYTVDSDGKYYCEEHQREMPLEKWTDIHWYIVYSENSLREYESQWQNEN
jgi:hypothetical protein